MFTRVSLGRRPTCLNQTSYEVFVYYLYQYKFLHPSYLLSFTLNTLTIDWLDSRPSYYLCISAKCWHQSVALPCTGNYVLPAAATTPYQEQEPSSATEHFQSLDQSSGTLSQSSSGQPTTFTHSNVYSKHTFSTFLTDPINSTVRHRAAILTVLTLYCLAGPARVRWALNTFLLD